MRKNRIAFILGSMGKGGAEKVVSVLAMDYARKGWETDILILLENTVDYPLHATTRVIDLSGNTQSRIRRLPLWLKGIRQYAATNRPDVILSFVARINIISQIATIGVTNKIYVSERNDPRRDGRSKLVDIATRLLYPRANGVIFQTKRAQSCFPRLRNGVILPNPISITSTAAPSRAKKIATAGRLTPQKNHHLLVDAFREVSQTHPEYRLEIYGEGELRHELQEHIHALGLSERVLLMGRRDNIHECIADAEIFILSSDYEGLSNALLEAMSMGIACISTDCAGSDEVIRDGENGMLIPVGDKDAMVRALNRMIENDELRAQCATNAKADAGAFRKEHILEQWHALID